MICFFFSVSEGQRRVKRRRRYLAEAADDAANKEPGQKCTQKTVSCQNIQISNNNTNCFNGIKLKYSARTY